MVIYIVQAGDTLFRVHSYFFTRESLMFKQSLEAPDEGRKGTSDSNALVLENTTAEQFATFLWLFYNPDFSRATTSEKWIIILDLAHRWAFPQVKALAISSLEGISLSLIERIALYQKYRAPMEIILPHYAALCARPSMLTLEEMKIIGSPAAIMIFSVRERLLSTQNGIRPVEQLDTKVLQRSVGSYFEAQLKKNSQTKDGQHNDDKDKDGRGQGLVNGK
ncbi:hypothetical protein AX15_006622 [Amanita polypyramis BW_CC]|nr:hypothetical protein AX15_006622 [Amanita polypyramis BW_CC]